MTHYQNFNQTSRDTVLQISSRFYVHTPDTQLFYLKSLHFSHALSHLDDFVWSTIFCALVYMLFITWLFIAVTWLFIAVTLEPEFMTYTMLAMWLAGTSNGSSSSSIQTSTVVLKSSVWCIELHADHQLLEVQQTIRSSNTIYHSAFKPTVLHI